MPDIVVTPFETAHYAEARVFLETTPGVGMGGADTRAGVGTFLPRNPDLLPALWRSTAACWWGRSPAGMMDAEG